MRLNLFLSLIKRKNEHGITKSPVDEPMIDDKSRFIFFAKLYF